MTRMTGMMEERSDLPAGATRECGYAHLWICGAFAMQYLRIACYGMGFHLAIAHNEPTVVRSSAIHAATCFDGYGAEGLLGLSHGFRHPLEERSYVAIIAAAQPREIGSHQRTVLADHMVAHHRGRMALHTMYYYGFGLRIKHFGHLTAQFI